MWSLAWPWALLALPLPFVLRKLVPESPSLQDAGLRVPSLASFDVLSGRPDREQMLTWRFWVAAIAWALLVVAAARPERIGDELDIPVAGRNLMLAVDLSGSMDQKDFELGNRRVDRLTATKAVASDFIGRREGDRIGLILFGERAYLQVPLTLDRETVKVLLLEAFIGLAGEKTAIGDAITLAVKRIHDQEEDAGEQVLVLLTDMTNFADALKEIAITMEQIPSNRGYPGDLYSQLAARYEKALARLSPEDQEAVVARVEMAGTYQELAEVLGKPSADAARMAVGRALVRLAKEMGHEG